MPIEIWNGKKPHFSHLHVFESKAYKLMKKLDKLIIISCDVIFEEMNN